MRGNRLDLKSKGAMGGRARGVIQGKFTLQQADRLITIAS